MTRSTCIQTSMQLPHSVPRPTDQAAGHLPPRPTGHDGPVPGRPPGVADPRVRQDLSPHHAGGGGGGEENVKSLTGDVAAGESDPVPRERSAPRSERRGESTFSCIISLAEDREDPDRRKC